MRHQTDTRRRPSASGRRGVPASLSPIELLLPDGHARTGLVLGSACPSVLRPSAPVAGDDPVDLVVVAPTRDERRDAAWVGSAARTAVSRLSPTGLVYVVPARARSLRGALEAAGLQTAASMLHIPDVSSSRHIVPIGTAAQRYVLSGGLELSELKRRAASLATRSSRIADLGPTGTILRRDPAIPLAAWVFSLDQPQAPGSVWITSRRASSGGSLVHRFVEGRGKPDAVAKVSPRAADELHGLVEIAPAAARAGVRVPQVLWSGEIGPAPGLLQSALPGTRAARLVERGRLDPRDFLSRTSGWLERWARAEARPRTIEHGDLDRLVLSPARSLCGGIPAYVDYLGGLCARAAGASCTFVPCHGDLTLANILVAEGHDPAVLDWEEASADGLPLTDLFYTAADAVAAADGYADRVSAARTCFAADGEHVPFVRRLLDRLAATLGLETVVREVCFHACWLHHASNEELRGSDPVARPFRSILELVAADVEGFSNSLFGAR
jgi:hypothetical protein